MDVRTVGIEEEFMLVDPETGRLVDGAEAVLRLVREDDVDSELDVVDQAAAPHARDPNRAFERPRRTRSADREHPKDPGHRLDADRSSAGGERYVALRAPPRRDRPKDRYRDMMTEFGAIGRTAGTCGMHVHVAIESREEGVGIIDRLRVWLPVVLALSANSPYFSDEDTGHASWRAQTWTRWPTGGATELFGSEQAYDDLGRDLIASGAARDAGMLYYDARLSEANPTVEVRIADVCTDPDDALIVAAVVRGLVQTAAAAWAADRPPPEWRTEVLRAASWRASRYGLAGTLVSPDARGLRPAREVLASVVDANRDVLEAAGDLARVVDGFERLLGGTGAVRQRAAYERTGSLEGVVADLVREDRRRHGPSTTGRSYDWSATTRRSLSCASAARAAFMPGAPWTPPPGWADADPR